jgi:hypothetical protein
MHGTAPPLPVRIHFMMLKYRISFTDLLLIHLTDRPTNRLRVRLAITVSCLVEKFCFSETPGSMIPDLDFRGLPPFLQETVGST